MTHALFLFSFNPSESGRKSERGAFEGGVAFKYKEWVIQKGVVESEKTDKKKKGYGTNVSFPKF